LLVEKILEFRSTESTDFGWIKNSMQLFQEWISPILTGSDSLEMDARIDELVSMT
jgi:hypothetical protein